VIRLDCGTDKSTPLVGSILGEQSDWEITWSYCDRATRGVNGGRGRGRRFRASRARRWFGYFLTAVGTRIEKSISPQRAVRRTCRALRREAILLCSECRWNRSLKGWIPLLSIVSHAGGVPGGNVRPLAGPGRSSAGFAGGVHHASNTRRTDIARSTTESGRKTDGPGARGLDMKLSEQPSKRTVVVRTLNPRPQLGRNNVIKLRMAGRTQLLSQPGPSGGRRSGERSSNPTGLSQRPSPPWGGGGEEATIPFHKSSE